MHKDKLYYGNHCKILFGAYVQESNDPKKTNA